jgi:hypothetical protein
LFPEQMQKLLQLLNCTLDEFVEAFRQEWKFAIAGEEEGLRAIAPNKGIMEVAQ